MRIAFLLGTFDPIHYGHVSMATRVLNEDAADFVYIVPTVNNPWKDTPVANFEQRCMMIANECAHINNCELERVEEDLFPPYYSCNTLDALYKKYHRSDDDTLYIIGGSDTISSLPEWMNYETMIKGRFQVIAFTRNGETPDNNEVPFTLINTNDVPDMSSTYIRRLASEGKNLYPYISVSNMEIVGQIYSNTDTQKEFYI